MDRIKKNTNWKLRKNNMALTASRRRSTGKEREREKKRERKSSILESIAHTHNHAYTIRKGSTHFDQQARGKV